jgi:F-type H+-transporting ATPase subunit b
MDAALQKAIGELLLNAVPTIVIFLSLYAAYRILVHKPLMRTIAERHELTTGAVAKAQADVAAAEAKTSDYERRLREARLQVFKAQEERRKKLMDARAAALAEARNAAHAQVQSARTQLDRETQEAKTYLQTQVDTLAQQVIRAVLKPAQHAPAAGGR